jgi:hypothetical protein
MDNHFEQVKFLCAACEYGHFFRIAKNAEGIPYDTHYTCGPVKGPRGPGGWDGKTCLNFRVKEKRRKFKGEITCAKGESVKYCYGQLFRLDKSILSEDGGVAKENSV